MPTIHRTASSVAVPLEARHELACCDRRVAFPRSFRGVLLCCRSALSGLAVRASQGSRISIAAVWAGPPLDDVQDKWKDDAKVSTLVTKTGCEANAARRGPEGNHGVSRRFDINKTTAGKLLFAGLFDTLNAQRSSVMNGLERVMRKQRDAAEKVRDDTWRCRRCRTRPRPTSPRSTNSATNWSGKPGFSKIGGVSSNSCVKCRPRSTSGCSRSAVPSSRRWSSVRACGCL